MISSDEKGRVNGLLEIEDETDGLYEGFSPDALGEDVVRACLEYERCPFDAQVELLITDDESIRELNRDNRGIDSATDVLSFPCFEFTEPGVFDLELNRPEDVTDPDTGRMRLGDIVISRDRMEKQAVEYGHSVKREYAFLLTHAMLHLCGYDHVENEDRECMEEKQRGILGMLGIPRE